MPVGPKGSLLAFFCARGLDRLDAPLLRVSWNAEVQRRGPSTKTGGSYLDVLSSILCYAQGLGILEANPFREFRESLRRRVRTQRARAETEPGRHIYPIESADELARLLVAAREEDAIHTLSWSSSSTRVSESTRPSGCAAAMWRGGATRTMGAGRF